MHDVDIVPHALNGDLTAADHHAADPRVLLDGVEGGGGVEHTTGRDLASQRRIRNGAGKDGLADFLG